MRRYLGVWLSAALGLVLPLAHAADQGARATQAARHEIDIAEALLRKRLGKPAGDSPVAVLRDPLQVTLRMPASALFDADSTELRPESLRQPPLSAVVDLLLRRYRLVGQINVYSDGIGGPILNHGLTEQRALALLAALHTTRIRPSRLTGTGLGAGAEIGSDDTPEGREQNRRVEVVFALPQPGGRPAG